MVALISLRLSLSARAFSSSISIWYCGSSDKPLGRTMASCGVCAAMPSIWLRACINTSWPTPPLSCRKKSKPVALPSSTIAGGITGITIASFNWLTNPQVRPCKAFRCWCGLVRSVNGFSSTNSKPEFCPRPAKLKPFTAITLLTVSFSFSNKCWVTACSTWSVRAAVAFGGSCTCTNKVPWSSSGKKAVGMRANNATSAASSST